MKISMQEYGELDMQTIEEMVLGQVEPTSTPAPKSGDTNWLTVNLPAPGAVTPVVDPEADKAKTQRTMYIMGGIFVALMLLIVVLSMTRKKKIA